MQAFHRRGCMFGAVFNALEFFGKLLIRCARFSPSTEAQAASATAAQGWRYYSSCSALISSALSGAGGLALMRVDELAQGGGGGESTLRDLRLYAELR